MYSHTIRLPPFHYWYLLTRPTLCCRFHHWLQCPCASQDCSCTALCLQMASPFTNLSLSISESHRLLLVILILHLILLEKSDSKSCAQVREREMWEWGWRRGLPTPRFLVISTLPHHSSGGRSAVRLCFHRSLSLLYCPSWRDANTLHMWIFPKISSASTEAVLGTSMGTACCFSSHSHSPLRIETLETVGEVTKTAGKEHWWQRFEESRGRLALQCDLTPERLRGALGIVKIIIMWPGNQHFRVGLILPWLTEGSSCVLLTP